MGSNNGKTTWCCRCGQQLGVVVRAANGTRRLKVGGVTVIGTGEVECPVCGKVRTWHASEEALERLVARMQGGR